MDENKKLALRNLTFGNQIAEEERDTLRDYFVKTQAWERIYNGDIDIVYGPKGSGKSALYVLIQDHADDLFDNRILLLSAENPGGTPAFRDLVSSPPTGEREFTNMWKLYFVSIIARMLNDYSISNQYVRELNDVLQDNHLLASTSTTLGTIISSVRRYLARYLSPQAFETSISLDVAGQPTFAGKIVFDDPDLEQQAKGYLSIDRLIETADKALKAANYTAWIMVDRLDVAFDDTLDLEKNALRALFRAYRDFRNSINIELKIFLRTDIWDRITQEGFREATHLSRDIHLKWNKPSLQNLIVRRLLNNKSITDLYGVDKDEILSSSQAQEQFFYRIFPDQVELGEKQSTTLDWMIRRTSDGKADSQPRDVILFLNKICEAQNQHIERGETGPSGEELFERSTFKEALPALSEYRVTKVLFAEYPAMRQYIDALREQKTEQTIDSLARIWKVEFAQANDIAKQLKGLGFFEERNSREGTTFWVPFLYRPYLGMSQGKADEV